MMNDLQFDKMDVDTSLAQEYLKKDKSVSDVSIDIFYNDPRNSIENMKSYIYNGKLFIKRDTVEIKTAKLDDKKFLLPETRRKLKDLASRLKENANLIAQLEFGIRKIPIEDTNAQLNLIIKHIKYRTQLHVDFDTDVLFVIFDGPLLLFGNIINILSCINGNLLVKASNETAIVSHLFVKLCAEAGLDSIFLEFVSDSVVIMEKDYNIVQGWNFGTVAIVSEDADVDSAVDTFISSSKRAPWYLRRILVQESVYQEFKEALSWKCNLKKQEHESKISNILCSETLTYNDREFLIDAVEFSTNPSVVTIEAYRTRKEVISLVQKEKPHFLSLWANGIAEINEVTRSITSSVIWVNTLADFRGPPQIAEAVFSNAKQLGEFKIKKCKKISKLCDLSKSWLKLDLESRIDILLDALDKSSIPDSRDPLGFSLPRDFMFTSSNCTMKSFVDIGNDYVCVGTSEPVGMQVIDRKSERVFTEKHLKSILYGNAFAVGYSFQSGQDHAIEKESKYYDILEQAGVPVVFVGPFVKGEFSIHKCDADTLDRVIWTNSGTIFAN